MTHTLYSRYEPEGEFWLTEEHPFPGASRYQLSLPQAETSNEMTVTRDNDIQEMRKMTILIEERDEKIADLIIDLTAGEILRASMASQIETQQARIDSLEVDVRRGMSLHYSRQKRGYNLRWNNKENLFVVTQGLSSFTVDKKSFTSFQDAREWLFDGTPIKAVSE